MVVCPHCGTELDARSRAQLPWWKYDPGPRANLGCGTLILIAIVVAVFSSSNRDSVARLEQEVRVLQDKVDVLGQNIEKLMPPAPSDNPRDRVPKTR